MVYGVIRSEVLSKTAKFRSIYSPDFALLAELALKGPFAQIPAPLFYRRMNRPDEQPEEQRKRRLDDLNPMTIVRKSEKSSRNLWRELRDAHLDIVAHAQLNLLERSRAIVITIICFMLRFKVRWHGFLFAENIIRYYLPKTLRRSISSFITKILGGSAHIHQASKK
jgi:hypothetical protein